MDGETKPITTEQVKDGGEKQKEESLPQSIESTTKVYRRSKYTPRQIEDAERLFIGDVGISLVDVANKTLMDYNDLRYYAQKLHWRSKREQVKKAVDDKVDNIRSQVSDLAARQLVEAAKKELASALPDATSLIKKTIKEGLLGKRLGYALQSSYDTLDRTVGKAPEKQEIIMAQYSDLISKVFNPTNKTAEPEQVIVKDVTKEAERVKKE